MKRLFLLRHAKSSPAGHGQRDFERPIDASGEAAALRLGKEVASLGLRFDRVLASPARRVVETLDALGQGLGAAIDPIFEERIYMADAADLLALIGETAEDVAMLLVVGHNPTLHEVAAGLTGDARLAGSFPTAAFAEIELPIGRWGDAAASGGKLVRLLRPGEAN